MKTEITKKTLMLMIADAHAEIMQFEVDTINTLLKKLRSIRDSSNFLEESIKKLINEQLDILTKVVASNESNVALTKIIHEVIDGIMPEQ